MSSTDRQNRLLLAEDWKRVYQSFRNADFKSYDFDNLRRTMIQYLRDNYPEDFNDYIESSEYLALVDLIAFLGQNIAFRVDLNARENYLELADRRESVLRLARLLSYNPKRNQATNGLLKLEGIKTTEEIFDSNGNNLAGQTVVWNDSTNTDWYEQFIKVMNSAMPSNNTFGRPTKKEIISGVSTEQYRLNSLNDDIPVYKFNKVIDGASFPFEIVSTDVTDTEVEEEAPFPGNKFAFIYKDDGKGISSPSTGFFSHFRQGNLEQGVFTVSNPSSNQSITVESPDINDSDVWLYQLDTNGFESELWSKVQAMQGNNIIYNNLNKDKKNIYSVLTRVDDRISLMFSDGIFGNLPQGSFRVYYRTSANNSIKVVPKDFTNILLTFPYTSKSGKNEAITFTYNLKYTVDNGAESESTDSVRFNAPSTYYTQSRMVTGEDYQIGPLGISQNIVKAKSVNRTSSGISRYFDLIDATGKYSQTTLYGNDGVVYKEYNNKLANISFNTKTDIEGAIENTLLPILNDKKVRNFYFDQFPKILTEDLLINWATITAETNLVTGYFKSVDGIPSKLGSFTSSILSLIKPGVLIKFIPPTGKHFNSKLEIVNGPANNLGDLTYKWVKVLSVNGTGIEDREDGTGSVYLNDEIPTGAILKEIKPAVSNNLVASVKQQVIDQIFAYKTFGLRFDQTSSEWRLVTENNLSVGTDFSTGKTGDTTNQQLDASWLLLFENDNERFTITYRSMRYVFESDKEIKFYYDPLEKIYDSKTGKIIKDAITILSINPSPDSISAFTQDFDWEIVDAYKDAEGYVDSKKIEVSFYDADEDGIVDDADLFEEIVNPDVNTKQKYVIFEKITSIDGVEDFNYVDNSTDNVLILNSKSELRPFSEYNDGQVFYYIDLDIFEVLDQSTLKLNISANYKARQGRSNLKFRYYHAASAEARIDPSASNIIDMFLLDRNYDNNYRLWLQEKTINKPLPPSSDDLFVAYANDLNQIKSLTDEIIYHPVKYKILFGNEAQEDLQATFKVVKNKDKVLNDNDIKSRIVTAINQFFALENWEFGETFYFSELANYVMYQMTPDLSTFVIVPNQEDQSFGSLYEIKSEADEVFISGATVADVEIIDAITASRLKSDGAVLTQVTTVNAGIQSSSYDDTASKITSTSNVINNTNRGTTY